MKPRGICGSGLISSIYELVKNKIIGQDGKFNLSFNNERIVVEDDGPQYILAFPEETETGQAVTIIETDIGNLIKSKGAVFAAIKSLIDYVGLSFEQLDTVYLAGGFGNFLNIRHAVRIGMLPDVSLEKVWFVGNTSIMGAKAALLSYEALVTSEQIVTQMTYVDLMSEPTYMDEFIRASFLPHTDLSLFPSASKKIQDSIIKEH